MGYLSDISDGELTEMMLVNLIAVFVGSLLLNSVSSANLTYSFDPDPSIPENAASGSFLTRVTGSGNGTVRYHIMTQKPDGLYQIGRTSGIITVSADKTPDAEYTGTQTIRIRVRDSQTIKFERLTVTVEDVNDHKPSWPTDAYGTIGALAEEGTAVNGSFTAIDEDVSPPNNRLKDYKLKCDSQFQIDQSAAKVTVKKDKKGPAAGCYYILLYVSDMGTNPKPLTGTTALSISVDSASCSEEKINLCDSASSAMFSWVVMVTALLLYTIQ